MALCSTAVVTMCFPTRRFCHRAAVKAQLSDSVPQEVKNSRPGSQSSASAIPARQPSTSRRACCP